MKLFSKMFAFQQHLALISEDFVFQDLVLERIEQT
jgi:hypothetical protein